MIKQNANYLFYIGCFFTWQMMGAKSDGWADKRNLTSISELKQIKLSVIVEYNMSSNCFFNQATSEGSADKLIIKASVQPLQC